MEINIEELKLVLINSIELLYKKDFHLIQNNLSERSIAHRLALHLNNDLDNRLSKSFGLDVDCEYNGDIDNSESNYRKRIDVLKSELLEIGCKVKDDDEIQCLAVYPDIIIHERGNNKRNILIIEIKKEYSGRTVDDKFDRKKLIAYTSASYENHLIYKLGAYVEFDTLIKHKSCRIDFYQEGKIVGSSIIKDFCSCSSKWTRNTNGDCNICGGKRS